MCKVIRGTTKVVVAHLCLTLCDPLQSSWTSLMAQMVKNSPAKWETWVWSLGWELPLEKGKGYPLQYSGLEKSKGLQRVRHDWRTFTSLCDHMDCSPPGFSVHGILQAKIKEWVAISFSRSSNCSHSNNNANNHNRTYNKAITYFVSCVYDHYSKTAHLILLNPLNNPLGLVLLASFNRWGN